MGPNEIHGDEVLISLSTEAPNSIAIPERRFTLSQSNPTITIGRSSKDAAKALVATEDNACFDSRVMSRKHAELAADTEQKTVSIRDLGSTHGTYVNGNRLTARESRFLSNGDRVTLGIPIYEHQENLHAPTKVRVGMEFKDADHANSYVAKPVKYGLDYNEFDEDDYSSSSSDIMEISSRQRGSSSDPIDLTAASTAKTRPESTQVDGDVALLSAVPDSRGQVHWSGFDDVEQEIIEDNESEISHDDRKSVIIVTNGNIDQPRGSDLESEVDYEEPRSESDLSLSPCSDADSVMSDIDVEQDYCSDDNRPDKNDKFLYAPEDIDEMDDQDQVDDGSDAGFDAGFVPEPEPEPEKTSLPRISEALPPFHSFTSPATLPPINYGSHLFTLPHPIAQREPSPSDAARPKSFRLPDIGSNPRASVDSFVPKSDKAEYFAARAVNKLSLAQGLQSQPPTLAHDSRLATAANLVNMACDQTDTPENGVYRAPEASGAKELNACGSLDSLSGRDRAVASTNLTLQQQKQVDVLDGAIEPTIVDTAQTGTIPSLLQSGESFLNSPLLSRGELEQCMRLIREHTPEQALTSADALKRWREQKEPNQMDVGASPSAYPCEDAPAQAISSSKEKRKAAEISDITAEDLSWSGLPTPEAEAHSDAIPIVPSTLANSSSLFPASANQQASETRPVKRIRRMAERVGYAALGGATVGAMVLTSLICSAPSFG